MKCLSINKLTVLGIKILPSLTLTISGVHSKNTKTGDISFKNVFYLSQKYPICYFKSIKCYLWYLEVAKLFIKI